MICKQCGREVPDHAIYCRYCGARLSEKEAKKASDLIPERPKRRTGAVIAAILALLALAGLFLWLRSCAGTAAEQDPAPAPVAEAPTKEDSPAQPEPEPVDYSLQIRGEDNIEAGKDVILSAVVEPDAEIKRTVWTSSDPSVATVTDGIVTGEAAGDTVIRCLIALQDGPVLEAELPFRVLPKPYTLKLEPEALELSAGTADNFSLEIETMDGAETPEAQIIWDSSDTMVAAVTDGRVQAVGEGTATITAHVTLPDGTTQTLTADVTVTPAYVNPTPSASQIYVPQPAPAPTPAPAPAPAPAPTPAAPTVTVFDPAGEAPEKTEDYLMANSDKAYLNVDELLKMNDDDLVLARNEIFARHGRQFVLDYIREYFEGKSWYQGTIAPEEFDRNVMNVLNEYEKANITRLLYAEEHN